MAYAIGLVLVIVNAALVVASIKTIPGDKSVLLSYLVGYVLMGPLLIASLFCIRKKNRNRLRLARSFSWASVVILASLLIKVATIYAVPPKQITGRFGKVQITVPASWRSNSTIQESEVIAVASRTGLQEVRVVPEAREEGGANLQQVGRTAMDRLSGQSQISVNGRIGPTDCQAGSLPCLHYGTGNAGR